MNCDKRICLGILLAAVFLTCSVMTIECSSADTGAYPNTGSGQGDGFAVTYTDSATDGLGILQIVFETVLPDGDVYLTLDGNRSAPISQSDAARPMYVPRLNVGMHTVSVECGTYASYAQMEVQQYVPVTGIVLDRASATLPLGGTLGLVATVQPADATCRDVVWTTSNASVASVDNGTVTALSGGSAVITAECSGFTASCEITVDVEIHVSGLIMDRTSCTMNTGDTVTLNVTVVPHDASDANIAWVSDNTSVVTVTGGLLRALSEGTATVTASCDGHSVSCTVTVSDSKIIDEVINEDGSKTVTETDVDTGESKETTTKETEKDGSVVREETVVQKDESGNVISSNESKTEMKDDGSKSETSRDTSVSDDGNTRTVIEKSSETSSDGRVTDSTVEISIRDDGAGISTSAVEKTDSSGNTVKESVTSVEAKTEVSEGKTIASVDAGTVDKVLAQIDTAKDNIDGLKTVVQIEIGAGTDASEVKISSEDFGKIAGTGSELKLVSGVGTVLLDDSVVRNVSSKSGDVSVSVGKLDPDTDLNEKQRSAVGNNPVYAFSIGVGSAEVHDLGGTVTVTIPYVLEKGQDASRIAVWYLDDSGNVERIDNAVYDAGSKCVIFTTTHFSMYIVGLSEEENEPVPVILASAVVILLALAILCEPLFSKKKSL